jgi:plastocyanin
MTTDERGRVSRRAVLGAVSSAAVALAGCFGDGNGTPTDTRDSDPAGTPTPEPTPTASPTASPTSEPADATVELREGRRFDPQGIAIMPGETIEWINGSDLSHTVTASVDGIPDAGAYFASGGFDTETAAREDWEGDREGEIAPGETFRHTFETRGVYEYFCIPHENDGMFGVVEVGNPTTTEN